MNMSLAGVNIGLAITGSFCTFDKIKIEAANLVKEEANVIPIFSFHAQQIDSRFGKAADFVKDIEDITNKKIIRTIAEAEPIGPQGMLDILLIAPCTGNTLAKLTNGITDTPVLMAAKGHIRNCKPLVISISTNDALGLNFKNLGLLMDTKGIYFVPFGQDNYEGKPNSMVAHVNLIIPTLLSALDGKQLQPVIL